MRFTALLLPIALVAADDWVQNAADNIDDAIDGITSAYAAGTSLGASIYSEATAGAGSVYSEATAGAGSVGNVVTSFGGSVYTVATNKYANPSKLIRFIFTMLTFSQRRLNCQHHHLRSRQSRHANHIGRQQRLHCGHERRGLCCEHHRRRCHRNRHFRSSSRTTSNASAVGRGRRNPRCWYGGRGNAVVLSVFCLGALGARGMGVWN